MSGDGGVGGDNQSASSLAAPSKGNGVLRPNKGLSISFFFSEESVAFHILMMTLSQSAFRQLPALLVFCLHFTLCPLPDLYCCISVTS